MQYTIRVILPDGKAKIVVEETYEADNYDVDQANNLALYSADDKIVVEIHNYNWISIKPASIAQRSEQ